jgi:hypothetical protein
VQQDVDAAASEEAVVVSQEESFPVSYVVQALSAAIAVLVLIAATVLGKRHAKPVFDLFAMNHEVRPGNAIINQPTMLGCAMSTAFLVLAAGMGVAIAYDSSTDNALRTETLLPSPYQWTTRTDMLKVEIITQSRPGAGCADAATASAVFGDMMRASWSSSDPTGGDETAAHDICYYTWSCHDCDLGTSAVIDFRADTALDWSTQALAWRVTTSTGDPQRPQTTVTGGASGSSTGRLQDGIHTLSVVPVRYDDLRTASDVDQPDASHGIMFSPPMIEKTAYPHTPGSTPAFIPALEPVSFTLRLAADAQYQRIVVTAKQSNLQILSGIFAIIMGLLGSFQGAFKFIEKIWGKTVYKWFPALAPAGHSTVAPAVTPAKPPSTTGTTSVTPAKPSTTGTTSQTGMSSSSSGLAPATNITAGRSSASVMPADHGSESSDGGSDVAPVGAGSDAGSATPDAARTMTE